MTPVWSKSLDGKIKVLLPLCVFQLIYSSNGRDSRYFLHYLLSTPRGNRFHPSLSKDFLTLESVLRLLLLPRRYLSTPLFRKVRLPCPHVSVMFLSRSPLGLTRPFGNLPQLILSLLD